jgi:hypothetical protein
LRVLCCAERPAFVIDKGFRIERRLAHDLNNRLLVKKLRLELMMEVEFEPVNFGRLDLLGKERSRLEHKLSRATAQPRIAFHTLAARHD